MHFTGRIRFHYNLINKTNFAFTSGLSLAGTSSEVDLYSKNNTIDFNNLNIHFFLLQYLTVFIFLLLNHL